MKLWIATDRVPGSRDPRKAKRAYNVMRRDILASLLKDGKPMSDHLRRQLTISRRRLLSLARL